MVVFFALAAGVAPWAAAESFDNEALQKGPLEGVGVEPAFGGATFDRPVLVTNSGDGTGRTFVLGQRGTIHCVPGGGESFLYADIRDRVRFTESENEEGLLGLAFHPRFAANGQLYVYYIADDPKRSVVSRFTVTDEPAGQRLDPASEEVVLTIPQPYWNHNGGTLLFDPAGMLMIAVGDGGYAHDPHGHGQDPNTLYGSVLRIDVDQADGGTAYGIPADNPFVGRPGEGRPEVWAYGLRNVWRMAFDHETGLLWAADVGQDAWEEVNLLRAGGNYGWNEREGHHRFPGPKHDAPDGPAPDGLIEPVWEYSHEVGKSITGGAVYRGTRVPALAGKYVYADYVAGKVWALDYDAERGTVTGNYTIVPSGLPVTSFGEDADGELVYTNTAGEVLRFVENE
ncbi:MAG: PQQ-dependent sugar dehydrogenase [Planctomycetota bacterium]